jgi:hypothetical protein
MTVTAHGSNTSREKGDKKMNLNVVSAIIGLGLIVSVPAWAQGKPENQKLAQQFDQMANETDWKVRTATGGVKGKWLLHQVKVRELGDRIKAGESVDAKEIDSLLREHSR